MRLLVVSNRLPVTVVQQGDGFGFQESVGGLVSGLSAYLDSLKSSSFVESEYAWVGWPGVAIDDEAKDAVKEALRDFRAYPVFLPEESMDSFYYGFCNSTIWPLFHYFPSYAQYDEDCWQQYIHVNEAFCDAVLEEMRPDDFVWVQDYHLMLLPGLLRQRAPEAKIGFFLHIPFPNFETFRLLPVRWRKQILQGLLGADLIGFHTNDYTQYFLRCVARILGHESDMGRILLDDRVVRADTFPMGIHFRRYREAAFTAETLREREELGQVMANFKVVLSLDRLDYSKGTINRLQGYEAFLRKYPEWHGKVVLVLVVVPSRVGVEDYQRTKRLIDELVGNVNGTYGSIDWTPILYQYKFLPFSQLMALYSASHVALVTPLRDGMNLIAKEYIAARTGHTGVLILSEMAGAAKEMGEAIIINPNDINEIADALKEALEMPKEEQARRIDIMSNRLGRYDVVRWADDFIQTLLRVKKEQANLSARLIGSSTKARLLEDFANARRRLLLLDYHGGLVPFSRRPQTATPSANVLAVLKRLAEDDRNEIVLISGRERDTLMQWFGVLNIGMVAEHGVWIKEKDGDWHLTKPMTSDWKREILPILEIHVDRLPGSFIEEKEFSVVWNYRSSDPEMASQRAREVMDDLIAFTANTDLQVFQGSRVIELRSAGVNKGIACLHWIDRGEHDFIIALGDDVTDEDLFRLLSPSAYSIKVGVTPSHARFNLSDHSEALKLLEELATLGERAREATRSGSLKR